MSEHDSAMQEHDSAMQEHDSAMQKNVEGRRRYRGRTDFLFVLLLIFALFTALLAIILVGAIFLSSLFGISIDDFFPSIEGLSTNILIYVGTAVSISLSIIFALLARWRIQRNRSYQFINGCPSCHKHDMIRIHRRFMQRQLANISRLPIRHYACRNCQWHGVLLFYYADGVIFDRVSPSPPDLVVPAPLELLSPQADHLADQIAAFPANDSDPDQKYEMIPDNSSEITSEEPPSIVPEHVMGRAIVIAPFGLSLRSAPNSAADNLLLLEPDTIVELLEPEANNSPANWRQVCYEGQIGWVSAAFLRHMT